MVGSKRVTRQLRTLDFVVGLVLVTTVPGIGAALAQGTSLDPAVSGTPAATERSEAAGSGSLQLLLTALASLPAQLQAQQYLALQSAGVSQTEAEMLLGVADAGIYVASTGHIEVLVRSDWQSSLTSALRSLSTPDVTVSETRDASLQALLDKTLESGSFTLAEFLGRVEGDVPSVMNGAGSSEYVIKLPSVSKRDLDRTAGSTRTVEGRLLPATITENFDGDVWGSWSRDDNANGAFTWGQRNCAAHSGDFSVQAGGGGTQGAFSACETVYPPLLVNYMWVDQCLESGTDVAWMDLYFQVSTSNEDFLGVCFDDPNSNYLRGYWWTGNWGGSGTWFRAVYNLKQWPTIGDLTDLNCAQFFLYFRSDAASEQGFGARVDDLTVTYGPGATVPGQCAILASPLKGEAPLSVAFQAAGDVGTDYDWYFDDGQRSSERNPTHVFASPGDYDVYLGVFLGDRSCEATVRIQVSVPCSYAISPPARSLGASSGSGSVSVVAAAGCAWKATADAPWLTVTGGSSGTGNGTVTYTVAGNSTYAERAGTITIGGKTFTVTQAGLCLAPGITNQPANVTINTGTSTTLTVAVTGSVPLTYQWYKGIAPSRTNPVGSNSPSFETGPLGSTTAFWVRVANACNQADSATATVTVIPLCALSCAASVPATALTGQPMTFASATAATNCLTSPTYAWDFGDGQTATDQSPTHSFLEAGSYTWSLAIAAGTETCTKSGTITISPGAAVYKYLISSQAHASGTGGTQWRSNVAVVNRTTWAANLTLTYFPYGAGTGVIRNYTLAAGATVEWQDVLASLFQQSASSIKGSVQIVSDKPVFAMARTFNQGTAGTFGQYYPAITQDQALVPGQLGVLPMLKKNSAYRTNIGILNVGETDCTVAIKLYNAVGLQVGSAKTQTVGVSRYWQEDDAFAKWSAGQQEIAYATVEVTTAGGKVWAYGSVVDAVTGDPTTVPVLAVASSGPYLISSQAHASGTGGTQWRSNAAVVNRNSLAANLTLTYFPYGSGAAVIRNYTLAAGATVEWQDVLASLFQQSASSIKGSVQIVSDKPVFAIARTFNQGTAGTFGQYYPAITQDQALVPGQLGVLPMLKKNSAYRTNIGILNVGETDCTVAIKLYNAVGLQVGSAKTQTVGVSRYWQEDDAFAKWSAGQQEIAYATVEVTTAGGKVWAYGSVVDAVTGDPTTVPVQRDRSGLPEISVELEGAQVADGQVTQVDFGRLMLGEVGPTKSFTVRNRGGVALVLGPVSVPEGFSLTDDLATELLPGASRTFGVTLATSVTGSPRGEVSFATNDLERNPFNFVVLGSVVAPPEVTVVDGNSPISSGQVTPVDLGNAVRGISGPIRNLTVRNDGGVTLTIGPVSVPAGFKLTKGLPTSLDPGRSDTLAIQLETSEAGVKTGLVSFATNDRDENPFSFTVTGRVLLPPEIFVAEGSTALTAGQAATVSFGTVLSGTPGPSRTFTVRNDGGASLQLGTVNVPPGFSIAKALVASLAAGQSDTLVVRLDSQVLGMKSGSVTIANNDPDENPFTFPVSGAVAQAGPRFDFGTPTSPVAPGFNRITPSTPYTPVQGFGWLSGTIESRDRGAGTDLERDFNFTTNGTFAVDVANGSYLVTVVMGDSLSPHDLMAVVIEDSRVDTVSTAARAFLTRTYSVSVDDGQLTVRVFDDGGIDFYAVVNALSIEALSAVPDVAVILENTALVSGQAAPVDFGSADQGQSGPSKTFVVRNNGAAPLSVAALSAPAGFSVSEGLPSLLPPWGSDSFTLQLTTESSGTQSGQVSIATNDIDENPFQFFVTGIVGAVIRRYDFGTAASPVEAGYTRVSGTTTYSPTLGFGWSAGTVTSVDRGTGNNLTRDYNATTNGTFSVDLPNGTYNVVLTRGDSASACDTSNLWLEGALVDWPDATSLGQFSTRTYSTSVLDGQLTLRIERPGGAGFHVVLNALVVTPIQKVGAGWEVLRSGTSWPIGSVATDGARVVAIGGASGGTGGALVSTDGVTFEATFSPGPYETSDATVLPGSGFLAVGYTGSSSFIQNSSDGTEWFAEYASSSIKLRGVVAAEAGTGPGYGGTLTIADTYGGGLRIIAVGTSAVGNTGVILARSDDGTAWAARSVPGGTPGLWSVAQSPSRIVAVGESGSILTSTTSEDWSGTISLTSASLYGVAWGGTRFVAIGDAGAILTSPDGLSWSKKTAPVAASLRSVAWGGGRWVAVGDHGAMAISSDGNVWSPMGSGVAVNLHDITWTGWQFVVVGDDGVILRGSGSGP